MDWHTEQLHLISIHPCGRFPYSLSHAEEVRFSNGLAYQATPFEINTPPVEDLPLVFFKGSKIFKWIGITSNYIWNKYTPCERFSISLFQRGVRFSKGLAYQATPFEINTPPVEDLPLVFFRGGKIFKWFGILSNLFESQTLSMQPVV